MPVTFSDDAWSFSNKPPSPEPLPSPSLYPTKKSMKDGRTIWISVPQPDRLTLVVPLTDKVCGKPVSGVSVTELNKGIGLYLLEEPANSHHASHQYFPNTGYKFVTLQMGPRGSFVRFEFLNSKKDGPRLRLDLNPRKLGPKGFAQLRKVLMGTFNLPALVAAARITRLDVAIDIVGLSVSEVLLTHQDQGKRSYYVASDGQLETINLHRKKSLKHPGFDQAGFPKKATHGNQPAGPVIVRAYDRAREREALKQPRPFGPAPVTRIEITQRRFLKWAPLTLIEQMDDLFKKLRVGFHQTQPSIMSAAWDRYTAVRRTTGPLEGARLIGLQLIAKGKFEAAYSVSEADLVGPGKNWLGWKTGLSVSGLMSLLS